MTAGVFAAIVFDLKQPQSAGGVPRFDLLLALSLSSILKWHVCHILLLFVVLLFLFFCMFLKFIYCIVCRVRHTFNTSQFSCYLSSVL